MNRLENFKNYFIVGELRFSSCDLNKKAISIYGNIGHIEDIEYISSEMKPIYKEYIMEDLTSIKIKSFDYADHRLLNLSEQFEKSETVQAIHRARPIHKEPINIFIYSSSVYDYQVDGFAENKQNRKQ